MKLLLTLSLLLTSVASADMLTLTGLPSYVVGGYYVGAMPSNFGSVVCMDWDRTTVVPSSFEVLIYSPSTPEEIRAAILFKYYLPAVTGQDAVAAVQHAIWNTKDSSFPDYGHSDMVLGAATLWQQSSSYDISNVVILSDPTEQNQRFLAFYSGAVVVPQSPESQVPEPATLSIVGLVLIGLGLKKYR